MNRAPEPARDGGRRGLEGPEGLMRDIGILEEGVGGRMEDADEAADVPDEGSLSEVPLLLYMGPGKVK